ncbi:MAG: E3 binding domain-containing protein [Bacteroidales bacterium]
MSSEAAPKVEADFLDVKSLSLAIKKDKKEVEEAGVEIKSRTPEGRYLSPLVRKIAGEEGLSHTELDSIKGTGMDGRITRDDILSATLNQRKSARWLRQQKKVQLRKLKRKLSPDLRMPGTRS